MTNAPLLVLLTISAIWPFGRDRDREKPVEPTGTIKDLERADVQVDTDAKIVGSEAKAMESYRLFLDVASDDPLLKAEAMRRLADLQLETADVEELASNVQSLGNARQHDRDVRAAARVLSELRQERSRALPARARLRGRRAHRRVARDARSAHRASIPTRRTSTRRSSAAARRCSCRSATATPSAPTQYVLEDGDSSPFYEQSLYKHGWAMFKQQQYEDSLTSFFGAARSPARHRQRRERRPRSRRAVFGNGARAAGARRRHVPRAVDRLLVSRRPRVDLALLQPRGRSAVRVHRLHELGRSLSRAGALSGRGRRVSRVRRARPVSREGAVVAGRGHRGVQEGRVRRPRARGQGELRRDLRPRQPVLAAVHVRAAARGRRAL